MTLWTADNRKDFLAAVKKARPGDCIRVESLTDAADHARELLSALCALADRGIGFVCAADGFDTRTETGGAIIGFCRALLRLERKDRLDRQREGIERAREEGKYKGRRPIAVDETLFDSVVALWKDGQITAREAMTRLDLKPNTFYRRIKDWEEQRLKHCNLSTKPKRAHKTKPPEKGTFQESGNAV